jgi:hypothetical protein
VSNPANEPCQSKIPVIDVIPAATIAGMVAHALETEVLGAIRGEIKAFEAQRTCSRVSGFLPNFACAVRIASTPSMALISPRI